MTPAATTNGAVAGGASSSEVQVLSLMDLMMLMNYVYIVRGVMSGSMMTQEIEWAVENA